MVQIEDTTLGAGEEARDGHHVAVHYTGMFETGLPFDSSLDRGEPLEFRLGSGQVIKGFDMGVLGMRVGGKRRVTIPPEFGYGNRQTGPIPANSTLIFELELVSVR